MDRWAEGEVKPKVSIDRPFIVLAETKPSPIKTKSLKGGVWV